jgi:site-specific recombinase XerD
MPNNKSDSVKTQFLKHLELLGLSSKSLKNYRSDLTHFLGWLILKLRSTGSYIESLTEAIPFLSLDLATKYKIYMADNSIPVKTINRRLSTLRHLSRFLAETRVLDTNFMDGILNVNLNSNKKPDVNPIIGDFRQYLENEKVSANTIKNYLSDIKHFVSWLETNNQIQNPKF